MKNTLLLFILLAFFTLNGVAQNSTSEAEYQYFEAMELYRQDTVKSTDSPQSAMKQEGKILCYPGIHITSFPIFCISRQGYSYFYVLTFSDGDNPPETISTNQLVLPKLARVQLLKVPVGLHISAHAQTFDAFMRQPKNLIEKH